MLLTRVKVAMCGLALLGCLFVVVACSSKQVQPVTLIPEPTTRPLPSLTATPTVPPTPSPTSTVDLRQSALDAAFADVRSNQIVIVRVADDLLKAQLRGWDGSDPKVVTALQDIVNACPGLSPYPTDLWPPFIKQARIITQSSCEALATFRRQPTTANWQSTWPVLLRNSTALSAEITKWPDYSDAQLRRVIAERQ